MVQFPDLESSILLANTWIDLSAEGDRALFDQPKTLPKRLIDVGHRQSPTVYLRDFSEASWGDLEKTGRYICLSHRWDATSGACTTDNDNFEVRKQGIELSGLPQTFQDAIRITRGLGLQYIWIDTLCIIQGSKPDWAEESAKMGSYYGLSWLTIGAGVESAQGLLEVREFDMDQLQYWKVDLLEPGNSSLYFTNAPVNSIVGNEQNSILRSRGWTLQEEILSHRYLGFQENQMYYRCGQYVYFESGFKELLFPPVENDRKEGEAPLHPDLILEDDWLSAIITDYSTRALSQASDRLPAISGIAHERHRLRGGHYVAGLWEEDLPQALCWSKEYAKGQCLKSVGYRAPSWSWAAIDGAIVPKNLYDCVVEADIIHVSTKPKELDPMGAVLEGHLVVCGVVRCGSLSTLQERSSYNRNGSIDKYYFHLSTSARDAAKDYIYSFIPDTSDFSVPNGPLWFLNITPQIGLALIPVSSHLPGGTSTFERVGLIEIKIDEGNGAIRDRQAWLAVNLQDEKIRTTITII